MGGGSADEIIMTSTSNPEVMAICYAQGWAANADYMTLKEAQRVTNIGEAFRSSSIGDFHEFQYFTGVTSIGNNAFRSSTITGITFPPSLKNINGGYCFTSCAKLTYLEVPEGVTQINGQQWLWSTKVTRLIIPSTVTNASGYLMTINSNGSGAKCTAICKATTPPTLNSNLQYTASINAVYVPDSAVDTYKADSKWGTISDKIKPVSELPL